MQELANVQFTAASKLQWPSLPKVKSLTIENLKYQGDSVEGDIILKYEFNGDHEVRQHFRTQLNQQVSIPLGVLTLHFHVWLDGAQLCFGASLCAGPICSGELKTCVNIPR